MALSGDDDPVRVIGTEQFNSLRQRSVGELSESLRSAFILYYLAEHPVVVVGEIVAVTSALYPNDCMTQVSTYRICLVTLNDYEHGITSLTWAQFFVENLDTGDDAIHRVVKCLRPFPH